jgi:hypothetical protein
MKSVLSLALFNTGALGGVVNLPLTHRPRPVPELRSGAAGRASRGGPTLLFAVPSVPITDIQGTEYFGELEIGNPPQKLKVVYDTGSADLWVTGKACSNCNQAGRSYDKSKSTEYKENGKPVSIKYLRGKCTGVLDEDTVRLGGLAISDFPFVEMTSVAKNFQRGTLLFDGILGMGQPHSAIAKVTPMQMLKEQGKIDHNVFAFYLTSDGKPGSTLSLGGPDCSYYTGDIKYTKLSRYSSYSPGWLITGSDVKVGGKSLGLCRGMLGCQMTLDTGASYITGPTKAMNKIIAEVGEVRSDCSNLHSLPKITISIGGADFELGPEFYVLRSAQDRTCHLLLLGVDQWAPSYILGDPFLRKYYTIFDADKRRVGFALAKQPGDRRSSSCDSLAAQTPARDDDDDDAISVPIAATAGLLASIGITSAVLLLLRLTRTCSPRRACAASEPLIAG